MKKTSKPSPKAKPAAPKAQPPATDETPRVRVFVVEDHPMLRRGLVQCINDEPGFTVCGEAGTAMQAMKSAPPLKPEAAIVDIGLPDGHGLELVKNIKALLPRLKVLVLSMHEESVYATRALQAGAHGYIMKKEPPEQVIAALRHILSGEVFLSPAVTGKLLTRVASRGTDTPLTPEERLSDRELEVFEMIGQGKDSKAIADVLHLSPKTVSAHRENIKIKLGLKDANALAHQAFNWVRDH
ncbi:MAG: response regulator transcription factor [Verrucomicrobia bacterium]|nr:response regulator transcription factor [Verrucomicrobiota bacterium]